MSIGRTAGNPARIDGLGLSRVNALEQTSEGTATVAQKKEQMLLIVNARTESKEITDSFSLARTRNANVSITYIATPLFVSKHTTPSEVDFDFLTKLYTGRKTLDAIAMQARKLGLEVSTNFVWAESARDIAKKYGKTVDVVVDKTA